MSEDHSATERAAERGSAARFPRDVIAGTAILAVCAIAYAVTLTFKEAPAAIAMNVQPATFPRLVIGVIAVLAAILIATGIGKPHRARSQVPVMVYLTALSMIAFVIVLDTLGIVPAMVLFCFCLPVLWGERRWFAVTAFSLAFPASVYVLFAIVLEVHFDKSPLVFW